MQLCVFPLNLSKIGGGCALALALLPALAQAAPPGKAPETVDGVPAAVDADLAALSTQEDDWKFTVSPYLWMPSLRGNGALDGHTGRFKAPFHKLVHDLNFVTMGNVTVNKGRYGMFFDGQYFDLSKHLAFSSADASADSSARSTQLSFGGIYQVYRRELGGSTVSGAPREWILSPTAGVHWTRMRVKAWGEGMTAEQTKTWAVPFIGLRSSYDLSERWNLSTQWDVGAWGRQYNLQGQTYLGYRLGIFGLDSMVRVGARILHQDYQDDGFHWNVSQYGPVVGLSMTF